MDAAGDRPALPRHAEIANLEHELAVLRERHAKLLANDERLKTILLYGAWATGAVAIALAIYAVVTGNIFGAVIVIVIAGTMIFGWMNERREWRLYDVLLPFGGDLRMVEDAIAIREKRLEELKAQSCPHPLSAVVNPGACYTR